MIRRWQLTSTTSATMYSQPYNAVSVTTHDSPATIPTLHMSSIPQNLSQNGTIQSSGTSSRSSTSLITSTSLINYYKASLLEKDNIIDGMDVLKLDLMKFEKLFTLVYEKLTNFLNLFATGDYASLDALFTMDTFIEYGQILVNDYIFNETNYDSNDYTYNSSLFADYTTRTHRILEGLMQATDIYKETLECLTLKEANKILYDKDLLKDFIDKYYGAFILFDLDAEITEIPIIKYEYWLYLNIYGQPVDGIFDSEKLANIIKNMDNTTSLTL